MKYKCAEGWGLRLYFALNFAASREPNERGWSLSINEFLEEKELCSPVQLDAWLSGKNQPTTITLTAIGAVTGIPWRWIASGCSIRQILGFERLPFDVVEAILREEKTEFEDGVRRTESDYAHCFSTRALLALVRTTKEIESQFRNIQKVVIDEQRGILRAELQGHRRNIEAAIQDLEKKGGGE